MGLMSDWSPFGGDFPSEAEFEERMLEAPQSLPDEVHLPPAVPTLYLDQQQWVRLLRYDTPEARLDADTLAAAVDSGELVVPLSSAHYSETWHRGRWESRWALARLMWDRSRLVTLAPIRALLTSEIATAMREMGEPVPSDAYAADIFGRGVNHAFASPTGRLRFVEGVGPDGAEGPDVGLEGLDEEARGAYQRGGVGYEWFSLAGFPADMRVDGLDAQTNRRAGRAFVAYEENLSGLLTSVVTAPLPRAVIGSSLRDIWDEVVEVCTAAGVVAEEFLWRLAYGEPSDRVAEFILAMPMFGLLQELRVMRHQNPQQQWSPNDRVDLMSLAVAAGACDAVVTERQWAHRCHQLARRRQIRAKVTASFSDALAHLGLSPQPGVESTPEDERG